MLPLLLSLLALAGPAQAPERPSVVVIMTDDQTYADMAAMPRTRRLIGQAGARFTRSYVSYPLCCPSRATYLTGQYNHNNGVQTNTPPNGGVRGARRRAHAAGVAARGRLPAPRTSASTSTATGCARKPDVPPGWTDWHGTIDKSTYQMYGYRMYENGVVNRYGNFDVEDPALYQTDVLRDKAVASIEGTAPSVAAVPVADVRRAARRVGRPGLDDRAVHPRRAARRRALPPPAAPARAAAASATCATSRPTCASCSGRAARPTRASAPTSARAASR